MLGPKSPGGPSPPAPRPKGRGVAAGAPLLHGGPSPWPPLPKGRGVAAGDTLLHGGPLPPARGAALLMALFIAALATLIVSGLFWRQFVLLRTIENQQLMSQSRLLLRGALDWARAILREDAA